MATAILPNGSKPIIDAAILEDLVAEATIETYPDIEDRPNVFSAFTAANAALIQPHLEALVSAYREACTTTTGRIAARLFLTNLLDAEA